ncbi:MAG: response regulator transcription factor [Chloroflexota bacterium]
MINVLLADDHQLMRQGVRRLLEAEPDITVVGEASNGLEAQQMARQLQPDVVLMDVSMAVMDGISATRQLVRDLPGTRVVILTMHSQDGHLFQAVQAGASGYVLKTAGADQVLSAVRAAAAGGSVIAPTLAEKMLNEFRRMASKLTVDDGLGQLNDVDVRILQLVASGMANKEIAQRLAFAESTVKNRLSQLFQKIGVADRTQAAIFAIKHGIAPLDSGSTGDLAAAS